MFVKTVDAGMGRREENADGLHGPENSFMMDDTEKNRATVNIVDA